MHSLQAALMTSIAHSLQHRPRCVLLSTTGYQQVMNFTKKVQLRVSALSKRGGKHRCTFHVMWTNVMYIEITV